MAPGRFGPRFLAGLDTPHALRRASWLGPLLLGLFALRLGQDANWDLFNYHLYNPYALLHGKVGYDLAPGQWQSYFNPTLDLLYYGLIMSLPAPLATLLMGVLHGLSLVLLLALARAVLPADADGKPPYRLILALAAAGCLGPGYMAELGNSMGDNTTALLVLAAVLVVVRNWQQLRAGGGHSAICAGLLAGCAAGLKLTNAGYALALCLALLLTLDAAWRRRLQAGFLFGCGVLAGIAVSAGHWYWRMWQTFGNPLFPQFNNIFHSPLAQPVGIGDTGWLPHGLTEKLLWPLITFADPARVGELPLRHFIWPLLYVAAIALAARWLLRRPTPSSTQTTAPQRMLLVFGLLSYLAWLNLFSIYRYLVPLELLAPLLFWLLMLRLLPPVPARRVSGALLLVATLSVLSAAHAGWGHAGRGWRAFDVATPRWDNPRQSMVLLMDAPMGWIVPFLPPELAVVSLNAGFPESPAYLGRMHAMLRERSGTSYAMLDGDPRFDAEKLQRAEAALAAQGLALDARACRRYPAMVGRTPLAYRLCPLTVPEAPRDSRTR